MRVRFVAPYIIVRFDIDRRYAISISRATWACRTDRLSMSSRSRLRIVSLPRTAIVCLGPLMRLSWVRVDMRGWEWAEGSGPGELSQGDLVYLTSLHTWSWVIIAYRGTGKN